MGITGSRVRRAIEVDERGPIREIPTCKVGAGLVPCNKMNNLIGVNNEADFYFVIKDLFDYVGQKCNNEWRKQTGAMVNRLKKALMCENGIQPDG